MPLINPDDIIRDNFKILSKRQKPTRQVKQGKKEPTETSPPPEPEYEPEPPPVSIQEEIPPNNNVIQFEEILVRQGSSDSLNSTKQSTTEESRSYSHGDESSVYVLEERPGKSSTTKIVQLDKKENPSAPQTAPDNDENGTVISKRPEDEEKGMKSKERHFVKKKLVEDDRRRNAWIPCTCPQYKVSKELATKWDLQGLFFGKILVVKVIQLMVINLVVFASVFESERTVQFFQRSHDWAYLSYALFVALLVSIRWGVGYRSRWPWAASFILMIPLTSIIAFESACITTVYNSILIPMVTCTIFLTFLMLCFAPYLLRRSVMHRSTNLAGSALALLSSTILLFLKEFETKPITYWEFVSHVWFPGVVLSQIAVQITVFEIQRIIFGLCFNVSTKRWHVAALYI